MSFNMNLNHPELALKNAIKAGRLCIEFPLRSVAVRAINSAKHPLRRFFIDELDGNFIVSWKESL